MTIFSFSDNRTNGSTTGNIDSIIGCIFTQKSLVCCNFHTTLGKSILQNKNWIKIFGKFFALINWPDQQNRFHAANLYLSKSNISRV